MASFRQRESGFWQAIVRRKGHPEESRTFRIRSEAEVWAREVESKIDKGVFVSTSDAERTTFDDLLERFKTEFGPFHYREREDGNETWRFQCRCLSRFFGQYALSAIDQKLIVRFREARLSGNGSRRAVGESTVRKELYMLSKILGFAETECGITLPRGNPVAKIRKPRDSRSRDRRLTAAEWDALECECRKSRNPWLASALTFAVETAMRQGEMLSLEWRHVDKQRHLAMLNETKNGEARAVPLSSRALEALGGLPRDLKGRVFPCERLTLTRALTRACARAGISDYRWHDLRHEALSRLAERGDFSVLELAAVSGHKTLQMLKRYTHLQAEKLAQKLG
ncbi:site-specific integrase [Propionivibrio limicola]|uniref:site-specific integrase n=1 Tax=Propionivibrio limicola TaxID=167645 RepID=UPI0012924CA8|nr:site-specific integrase [Propionivibrio limicola]